MNELVEAYRRIAPELMDIVEERFHLLQHIAYAQPVGRRMLAQATDLSERIVRSHVEIMKDNGLIDFTAQGMRLSPEGEAWLPKLRHALYEMNKISDLEASIRKKLALDQVIISGSEGPTMIRQLGFTAAKLLVDLVKPSQVIAVSGGSTMAAVAESMPKKHLAPTVIPARGGIGERMEHQANVIAAIIGERLQGTYKMLHLPDGLSEASIHMLVTEEPQFKEISELTKRVDILLFGIGEALHMAEKRHMEPAIYQSLADKHAVGEALGHYCDEAGHIVYATNNVGIAFPSVQDIPHVIAVAGGSHKAKAIIGVMRAIKKGTLIIDEQAAIAVADALS